MIYVVLGMHKSGTTLVARLLHESGIPMGDFDERLDYGQGNRFERHDVQEANRQLLHGYQLPPLGHLLRRPFRPSRDAAGYPSNRDSQAYIRSRALRRRLERPDVVPRLRPVVERGQRRYAGDWGFKDPRTCLTFPAWERVLPECRLVVVHRSPAQVLSRSRAGRRHPLRALRVLQAWCVYNEAILRVLERSRAPRIVLRYEALMESDLALEQLSKFVGRPLQDARRERLYRTREAAPLPGWCSRLLAPMLPLSPLAIESRLRELSA